MNKIVKVMITAALIAASSVALLAILSDLSFLFNKSQYETVRALGDPRAIRNSWLIFGVSIGVIMGSLAVVLKLYAKPGAQA